MRVVTHETREFEAIGVGGESRERSCDGLGAGKAAATNQPGY